MNDWLRPPRFAVTGLVTLAAVTVLVTLRHRFGDSAVTVLMGASYRRNTEQLKLKETKPNKRAG